MHRVAQGPQITFDLLDRNDIEGGEDTDDHSQASQIPLRAVRVGCRPLAGQRGERSNVPRRNEEVLSAVLVGIRASKAELRESRSTWTSVGYRGSWPCE